MDTLLIAIALIPSVLLIIALIALARHSSSDGADIGPLTEQLTQARLELRSLSERLQHLEETQGQMHNGLNGVDRNLASLQAQAQAKQEQEAQTAASIRRLEMIIAGTQSKGGAGENILESVFAKLPPEWQARNFRVGNKVVEFGLRLPNNLILPIDSKWPATSLMENYTQCANLQEQLAIKGQIESAVIAKAKEVRKYIDPATTVSFGVAAIPDAVYDLCYGIQAECFQLGVVLVSYSLFLPYLLLVFQTVRRNSQSLDLEKLQDYAAHAQDSARLLQEELDGRLARTITMLSNSRNDMAVHLGRISSGLAGLQVLAPSDHEDDGHE